MATGDAASLTSHRPLPPAGRRSIRIFLLIAGLAGFASSLLANDIPIPGDSRLAGRALRCQVLMIRLPVATMSPANLLSRPVLNQRPAVSEFESGNP